MFSIIGIFVSIVGWIGKLYSWLTSKKEQKIGATNQAVKEISATAKTETAIANAEVNAPKSIDAIIDREENGTF
jgi:hypothetical protein